MVPLCAKRAGFWASVQTHTILSTKMRIALPQSTLLYEARMQMLYALSSKRWQALLSETRAPRTPSKDPCTKLIVQLCIVTLEPLRLLIKTLVTLRERSLLRLTLIWVGLPISMPQRTRWHFIPCADKPTARTSAR